MRVCFYIVECGMHVRSFCLLTFAPPSLAALALPAEVHAAPAVHGRTPTGVCVSWAAAPTWSRAGRARSEPVA
jgi:hypothetical protein